MKFRHHRGGLKESLETTVEVNSLEQLIRHLNRGWEPWGKEVAEIKFDYVGMDDRTGWDSYYVLQRLHGEDRFTVAGMSDGEFNPVEELKLEWQKHNRDNGLSWNEVADLVNQVVALVKKNE